MKLFNAIDLKKVSLVLALFVALVGGSALLISQLEWVPPTVEFDLSSTHIGTRPFDITLRDRGKGLSKVAVSIVSKGQEHSLVEENYRTRIAVQVVRVTLSRNAKIPEGPASLRVRAIDGSYWNFFRGNETTVTQKVVVDLTPPKLQLLKTDRYVNHGGSGLLVYRSSPDTVRTGVQIGRYFFPGYGNQFNDRGIVLAFFAHPYDLPHDEKAWIVSEDAAGNRSRAEIPYSLKRVGYKQTTIRVTEQYINHKVAPLASGDGGSPQNSQEKFIRVNRELRNENDSTIRKVCASSVPAMLWREPFHQLSNSKVEATFAEKRTYYYGGQSIDQAYHLGYDLAVTRHYPVEAANNGVVVFAGDLGIYGNTVILDHGLGIFTLYSHLSSVNVERGKRVERKGILGKTGETGLAVGDHLHFATLIHGIPVYPLEWWDGKWIQENIIAKIDEVGVLRDSPFDLVSP